VTEGWSAGRSVLQRQLPMLLLRLLLHGHGVHHGVRLLCLLLLVAPPAASNQQRHTCDSADSCASNDRHRRTAGYGAWRRAIDDGGPYSAGAWRSEGDTADAITDATARDEDDAAAVVFEQCHLRDEAIGITNGARPVGTNGKALTAAQIGLASRCSATAARVAREVCVERAGERVRFLRT